MDGVLYSEDVRATLAIWEDDVRYKRNLANECRLDLQIAKAEGLENQAKAIEDCIADMEAMLS